MDKKTARNFIERIEAHREQELAIWDEMRSHEDYRMNEDMTITDILKRRRTATENLLMAEEDLDAFNWIEDAEGNFVPREDA